MLIKRTDLVNALDAVKGGVAQKSFSPILTHVLIDGDTVMTFDSEIGIKVKLQSNVGGKFLVRFEQLYNLLRALDGEDLYVEVDGTKVRLQCGRHRSTLVQMVEEFPRPQVGGGAAWNAVPSGFKEALERALLSVHESESEKLLCGVLLRGDSVYSHNRSSAVICTLPEFSSPTALLSKKAVEEIIRLGQPTRFAVAGPWTIWDYGNLTLLARLREGAEGFPPVWDLLSRLGLDKLEMQAVPEGIIGALNRLTFFGSADDKACTMRPGSNEAGQWVELVASNERGTITEMLDGTTGPAGKRFNPAELARALPYASSMSWGTDASSPLYIVGEAAGFKYLQSPMRTVGA